MRRFKSVRQAQEFMSAHATVSNLLDLGRHLVQAQHYRDSGHVCLKNGVGRLFNHGAAVCDLPELTCQNLAKS
jgi:putative transposase